MRWKNSYFAVIAGAAFPSVLYVLTYYLDENSAPEFLITPVMLLYFLAMAPVLLLSTYGHWSVKLFILTLTWSLVGLCISRWIESRRKNRNPEHT